MFDHPLPCGAELMVSEEGGAYNVLRDSRVELHWSNDL
jgi:hypothetical protein